MGFTTSPKSAVPSSALGELGPPERREGGSRHPAKADHIHLAADVQFCSHRVPNLLFRKVVGFDQTSRDKRGKLFLITVPITASTGD
jgi:hypothetical protein